MKIDKVASNILMLMKYELSFADTELMNHDLLRELVLDLEIYLTNTINDNPKEIKRLIDEYLEVRELI